LRAPRRSGRSVASAVATPGRRRPAESRTAPRTADRAPNEWSLGPGGLTPKISVVTTVYNGEPYFDRAIPGILAQTFEDFEFILVDDGSTDRSLERLRELSRSDPRVRVFAPGRLGAAAAYNYGVAQATGEYVGRQDFDDRSHPA